MRRTAGNCRRPYYFHCLFAVILCLRKLIIFSFLSGATLHCILLLAKAALILAVFWSSRKLTSLRRTGASALPPLTIFHSPPALQLWLDCTQMGHRPPQCRRCCIPAQPLRCASPLCCPPATVVYAHLLPAAPAPSNKVKSKWLIINNAHKVPLKPDAGKHAS